MSWIIFAVLTVIGVIQSIVFYDRNFYSSRKRSTKDKVLFIRLILWSLANLAGVFIVNWRVGIAIGSFVLSGVLVAVFVLSNLDYDLALLPFLLACIFFCIGIFASFVVSTATIDTNETPYELVSTTNLVALSDTTVMGTNGSGSAFKFYVESEANNVYSYRYEAVSDIDGSKIYKKASINGNVEEKEVDDCDQPRLEEYLGNTIETTMNYFTGKTKEKVINENVIYVFVVPKGSIQKTINLE